MDKRITGQEFNAGPFGFLAFVVLLKFRMGFRLGTFLWLQYFIFYAQPRVFYSTLVSSIPEPLLFLRVLISFLISDDANGVDIGVGYTPFNGAAFI